MEFLGRKMHACVASNLPTQFVMNVEEVTTTTTSKKVAMVNKAQIMPTFISNDEDGGHIIPTMDKTMS